MKRILTYFLTFFVVITTATLSQAGKLEVLEQLYNKNTTKLAELKAIGLGHAHPKIKQIEKTLEKLDLDILNAKELRREIIVMLDGTKSKYLEGHARHGKTDAALTELLDAGWKIQKIIPIAATAANEAPDNKANLQKAAYVWLNFDG